MLHFDGKYPHTLTSLKRCVIGIAAALVSKRGRAPHSPATPSVAARTDSTGAAGAPAMRIADAGVVTAAKVAAEAVAADAAAPPDPPGDGVRAHTRDRKPTSPSGGKQPVSRDPGTAAATVRAAEPSREEIQVLTDPEGASLYIDRTYSGKGGTRITRPQGTTLTVECRLAGYNPGRARLAFDGKVEIVMCRPTREKRCVDGLKNPFDDCPDPD